MAQAQFIEKTDFYGLSELNSGNSFVCLSSDEGKSSELAEAKDAKGSIIAYNVFGEKMSPSNSYSMKDANFTSDDGDINLGDIKEINFGTTQAPDKKWFCLNSITINTQAGSAPTIDAGGEQVENNCDGGCTYPIPAFTLKKKHHAQILFGACTDTYGTGNHLQSASYSISASITNATKEGIILTHDIVEGKIECSLSIVQTGSVKPTVTIATGSNWFISSPLTCSNPDADYPTWSCTLTLYLEKDDDSESESD